MRNALVLHRLDCFIKMVSHSCLLISPSIHIINFNHPRSKTLLCPLKPALSAVQSIDFIEKNYYGGQGISAQPDEGPRFVITAENLPPHHRHETMFKSQRYSDAKCTFMLFWF